jgi:hypothetical protein
MNLKTIFNWLAAKDDLPLTFGLLARKTILKGTKLENKESSISFTRSGRLTERGVTLTSCFAAASAVSFMSLMAGTPFFTVPILPYILASLAVIAVGKSIGIGAGKATDFVTNKINNIL